MRDVYKRQHYYMNLRGWSDSSYHFGGDTLRLFLGEERAVHRIPCRELLERQLKELSLIHI